MRSLHEEEHEVAGPVGPVTVAGSPSTAADRSAKAPPHREPSHDRDGARSLLAYLRACLSREAVHTHVVPAARVGTDTCACLPTGPEILLSGAGDTLRLDPGAARVVRVSRLGGQALRYGYPLVVLGEGDDRAALPLLTVDVRAADEPDALTARPGCPAVRAVGPPDVNPALLTRLGVTDADDLFELRARLRAGTPAGVHRPAAVADLAAKVRALLNRLEIERVDDIDPRAARGRPAALTAGAHNTAVLFRAGPEDRPDTDGPAPGTVAAVLADLDPSGRDGLDPDRVAGTALEPLLDRSAPGPRTDTPRSPARPRKPTQAPPPTAVPVSATALDQSQYAVLDSAMRERLTVAATPPGTGAFDLVDALVRTATAHGQRTLVCAHGEDDLAEITRRAGTAPEHHPVRVGGPEHRETEMRRLDALLTEHTADRPRLADDGPDTHWADLARDWERVRDAWRAMDTMASGGAALAYLAAERARSIAHGWDPDALFTPERGGPEYWLRRAEAAGGGGLSGLRHRGAVRRELGVSTDPENLARLCAVASMERDWRRAVDQRTRCAPLDALVRDLADALARHRRSGAACLTAATEPRLRRGRAAIAHRLEALNWHDGPGWPGMPDLLDTLPTWMCRTGQVRALPPQPGFFDLVVVVGAERTRAAELLPALYRATRAVVLGDPAHPGPASVLEPSEERRAVAAAGVSADRLDEQGLRYGSGSALWAARRAAPELLWLDEHTGGAPRLAEAAARHCYGGRVSVRTVPDPDGGPVLRWYDVAGACEAAPGASYVNRDEAYRAAIAAVEADAEAEEGAVIAVVAPTQPQIALIRRQLRTRHLDHEVRVGGPEVLSSDARTADVTVLSPMLGAGAPAIAERRIRRMDHLWSAVLTRTRRRLVVVGDRGYWSGGDGPLADLDTTARGRVPAETADPLRDALADRLRETGATVEAGRTVRGWTADLIVGRADRHLVVLLDRGPDGRALRHLVRRGEALGRATGDPVVLVPAWRCLADTRALVQEILVF
ncbi:DNA helicase [Nocardiopsis sp. LOL_012]|uniref:DNA helicase n=1 Tax=Nocardiopsis sp. LOL_012 TaxID=3345409 RepID=UPI003A87DA81